MHNIKTSLLNTLDLLQFAYRPNHSTDDAISSTLHLALTHLENKDSYVRMLFIDFSSAFNTIIPQQLVNKLNLLGLNYSLCNWILDFLTRRPQSVRVGYNTSSTTPLSTGAPQGCVLSPLLFTQLTHDCTAKFSSDHIIKFANDTSVVGLISNNDESHYRMEVAQLNGVVLATCPSMWVRQRKLWWTSGKTRVTTPHWPSCWPAASLSGTGTVVQRTARPSSGQWTTLQRSSVPICPPSWTFYWSTMLQ